MVATITTVMSIYIEGPGTNLGTLFSLIYWKSNY